jgi:uncharacterized coiled-coil protein SlyX
MSSADASLQALEARLEDLEVRYAYLERLIADLDSVVRQTADEMAGVKSVVRTLKERAEAEDSLVEKGTPQQERPPHY